MKRQNWIKREYILLSKQVSPIEFASSDDSSSAPSSQDHRLAALRSIYMHKNHNFLSNYTKITQILHSSEHISKFSENVIKTKIRFPNWAKRIHWSVLQYKIRLIYIISELDHCFHYPNHTDSDQNWECVDEKEKTEPRKESTKWKDLMTKNDRDKDSDGVKRERGKREKLTLSL